MTKPAKAKTPTSKTAAGKVPKVVKTTKTKKAPVKTEIVEKVRGEASRSTSRQASSQTQYSGTSMGMKVLVAFLLIIPLIILFSLIVAFGVAGIGMIVAGIVYLPVAIITLVQSVPVGVGTLGAGLLVLALGVLFLKAAAVVMRFTFRGLYHFFAGRNTEQRPSRFPNSWLAFTLIFMIAGVALLAASWGLGANGSYAYIDGNGIHVVERDDSQRVEVHEQELEAFTSVDVSTISARVELVPTDYYGFEVSLPGSDDDFGWEIENGKLVLDTQKEWRWRFHVFNFDFDGEDDFVKIYYPRGTEMKQVSIKTVSGEIAMDGFSVRDLWAKTVSGDILGRNIVWEKFEGEAVSGKIEMKGTAGEETSMKTISGRVRLETMGNTNDFNFDFDSVSGNARVNDNRWHDSDGDRGKYLIRIKTISGDAQVDFVESAE